MRPIYLRAATGWICAWSILAPLSAQADEAKDTLIVETILRLEDFDLTGSEKAQAAVSRYLENNWGGERYLDLPLPGDTKAVGWEIRQRRSRFPFKIDHRIDTHHRFDTAEVQRAEIDAEHPRFTISFWRSASDGSLILPRSFPWCDKLW
ncbi:MAG: hypothetical protein ACI8XO_004865 [Verrucomicrobiales bacterium]|jgi:hypothetical protein